MTVFAIVLVSLVGVTNVLLLQAGGIVLVIAAIVRTGVIYWVIDPKPRAVSADYEAQQENHAAPT